MNDSRQPSSVGWVSPSGRNPTNAEHVGLRDETANPTYGAESDLPYKVDIVDWATTSPSFRKIIERDKVVVQSREKPSEWQEVELGSFAKIAPSRTIKKGVYAPFVDMAALPTNGREIDKNGVVTKPFSGSGSRFKDGDTLLARITPCLENGKTCLVDGLGNEVKGHGSTEFIVLSPRDQQEDSRFIYYLARSPDFRDYAIHRMEGTSGRQRVPASAVSAYRFLCPPPAVRKEIANTLGILDDKITLLRESNATLEAIAQALFKSWFVDFDPVRAKMEGREPEGMNAETAALFPDGFEDSELGEIPRGWQAGTLGEIANNIRISARHEDLTDETAYIGLEHMPRHSIALDKWDGASKVESGKSRFKKGQILFGKLRPYFHKVGIAPLDGVCSTDILVLEAKVVAWHSYCVCQFSSKALIEYATQLSNGAKMPRTNWTDIANYRVALPTLELAQAFEYIVAPMLEEIAENVHQARSLSELRDTLLPRLMSGKLCLPEAETLLDEAVA